MNFLNDTNIISEWVKPKPDPGVIAWLESVDEDRVFISTVTLAEIRYGVESMPACARRNRLDTWLNDELPVRFEGRILTVDATVGNAWGRIIARSRAMGNTMGVMDGFLAATAEVHGLTLVTRNVSHFQLLGSNVLNPWTLASA